MKKALTITGRVELSREEITKAIIKYLKDEEQLATEKVVYEYIDEHNNIVSANTLHGAVVTVHQAHIEKDVPEFGRKVQSRNQASGYRVLNRGVSDTIRHVLNEKFKQRGSLLEIGVNFDELYREVIFHHPAMDRKKLYIYLYDRRQLPNTDFRPKENRIMVTGDVHHV